MTRTQCRVSDTQVTVKAHWAFCLIIVGVLKQPTSGSAIKLMSESVSQLQYHESTCKMIISEEDMHTINIFLKNIFTNPSV